MIRFVFVVVLFAAVVYLLVRFALRRGSNKAAWGPATRRQQEQRRTIAPDDDDQFLRDLDKKRKDPDDPEPPTT